MLTSTVNFNPFEQFTRWHVEIDEEGKMAMFLIEWSKTIQHCKKELWVPVMLAANSSICLIQTLRRYFNQVVAQDADPMFCYRDDKDVLKALTYSQLSEQLKDWVKKTGRVADGHTLHGLRRGGTLHAFRMGIKLEFIKMMGDWASQCFFRYLDVTLDDRLRAAVRFVK